MKDPMGGMTDPVIVRSMGIFQKFSGNMGRTGIAPVRQDSVKGHKEGPQQG